MKNEGAVYVRDKTYSEKVEYLSIDADIQDSISKVA
jgi:hypothetical protein